MTQTNVVYIADKNYYKFSLVSIVSLMQNTNARPSITLILLFNESTEEKEELIRVKRMFPDIIIEIVYFDSSLVKNIQAKAHVSQAAYAKLFLPEFLKEKNEIIFIDGDTLIMDDICNLHKIRKDINCSIGAVWDIAYTYDNRVLEKEDSEKNFNSGVMYMNLERMREKRYTKHLLDFVETKNHLTRLNDQAAFNYVLKHDWSELPRRWNVVDTYFWKTTDKKGIELKELLENPGIIHFTGSEKPWNYKCAHPYKSYFREILNLIDNEYVFNKNVTLRNRVKSILWRISYTFKRALLGNN